MDTTGFRTKLRSEREARDAAAAAHASYYAHPSLHLHTYLPRKPSGPVPQVNGDSKAPPVAPPASSAPSAPSSTPATAEVKNETVPLDPSAGASAPIADDGIEGGMDHAGVPSGMDKGAMQANGEAGGLHTSPGPSADEVRKAVEAGQDVKGMEPHLQLMCGPMVSYYTVKDGHWKGAAMIVTADEGSIYDPTPSLSLTFQTYAQSPSPNSTTPTSEPSDALLPPTTVSATKFHTYSSGSTTASFWRFILSIPLQSVEMAVRYRLNKGAEIEFVVPALGQNLRWIAHSCNGFSSSVNPDEFKGPWASGYDPLWEDVLLNHHNTPYHCMVGGGDQIYCDAITREPELQSWINAPTRAKKLEHPLTEEMNEAIDRFYFNHYCKIFRGNAFGRANSTIPMVNMLDDHDLIDGFGTYDDDTQAAPVFSFIGSRGYFWYLIFQLFVNDVVDGTNPVPWTHPVPSMLIGGPGAWIPFPSHSLLVYLGPKVTLLALDCRAERKLGRIVSKGTYDMIFAELRKIPEEVEQLVMLLGVPIAYPRMSFLEHFLNFKYNPINFFARHNAFGLGGMVNKFNQAAELLDDLNDHWCANTHKSERNSLVLACQDLARTRKMRITFLSGDVHLAAVGCLYTYEKGIRAKLRGNDTGVGESAKETVEGKPEKDWRYMLNVVTSAIVNTPPPAGAAKLVAVLGSNTHRTLPQLTDEKMIPLFEHDTDGSKQKRPIVLARRNYTSVEYKPSGELTFDFRVEKSQGAGETVSYPISAPPPRWKHTE